jgi:hypothetical protein
MASIRNEVAIRDIDCNGTLEGVISRGFYSISSSSTSHEKIAIFDPGATDHVVPDLNLLHHIEDIKPISMKGVGSDVKITKVGFLGQYGRGHYFRDTPYLLLSQRSLMRIG